MIKRLKMHEWYNIILKEKNPMEKGIKKEYRDRLFKYIFGNGEHKEWALSLYNAVNNTQHTDADLIEFNTIQDAVYMGMKNDISFLFDNAISLYEQQSTYNPNMPARFLIYIGMVYDKYVNSYTSRFSTKLQKLPAPKCICFYNGKKDTEDKCILKLSDSFEPGKKGDAEIEVTMLNINYGHNQELLEACTPLSEYSLLISLISKNMETNPKEKAVDMAIDALPENSVLKQFLLDNKAEVRRMCITEYDEREAFARQKEEGREEVVVSLFKKGKLSSEEAAEELGISVSEFEKLAAE